MRKLFYVVLAVVITLGLCEPREWASAASTDAYHRMVAKLHSLKSYKATIDSAITLQVKGGGAPRTIKSVDTVLYKKPNKISLNVSGLVAFQVVSDGKTMYQYAPEYGQYTAKPAPADLVSTLLMNADHGSDFKEKGSAEVGGVPVVILKGLGPAPWGKQQVTLYVGRDDSLLYRVIAVSDIKGTQGQGMHMVSEEDFVSQRENVSVSDSQFRFVPPGNAAKVSSLGGFGGTGGSPAGIPGLP